MKTAFQAIECEFFLEGGTLLGAVRDNALIPWDWEAGVAVRYEDLAPLQYQFIEQMKEREFIVTHHSYTDKGHLHIDFERQNDKFEVGAYSLIGDLRSHDVDMVWTMPSRFMHSSNVEVIRFEGEDFFCLGPKEEYLGFTYGKEWRTPMREDNKLKYLTEQAYNPKRKPQNRRTILSKCLRSLFATMRPTKAKRPT
jgi:hypothetical protein